MNLACSHPLRNPRAPRRSWSHSASSREVRVEQTQDNSNTQPLVLRRQSVHTYPPHTGPHRSDPREECIRAKDTRSAAPVSEECAQPSHSRPATATSSISLGNPRCALPRLLEVETVDGLQLLDSLLVEVETCSVEDFARSLPELLNSPTKLALTFAATSASCSWLETIFPLQPTEFHAALSGQLPRLMSRLADVPMLPAVSLALPRDVNFDLNARRDQITACIQALAALSSASFNDTTVEVTAPPTTSSDGFRQSQGDKKRIQREAAARSRQSLNPAPFTQLRLELPCSAPAADATAKRILHRLGHHLKYLLKHIRRPESVNALKQSFLRALRSGPNTPHRSLVALQDHSQYSEPSHAAGDPVPAALGDSVRTALRLANGDQLGPWRVIISGRAERNLRELHSGEAKMFQIVMKKITELSEGMFTADNMKRLTVRDAAVPVYEAKMTRDTRLVYRIDCVRDYGIGEFETQVVKIHGVYSHTQINRSKFWNSMGLHLARQGPEYRRRCVHRLEAPNRLKGDRIFAPASFPALPTLPQPDESSDPQQAAMSSQDWDEMHELLALEKYVVLSQGLLNSIIADVKVTFPFTPSACEQEIIEYPSSCYVVGRSGTGKTTTIAYKMLKLERAYELHPEMMRKPRQLFVTQSRVLALKVEEYFHNLLQALQVSESNLPEVPNPRALTREDNLLDQDDDDDGEGARLPSRFSQLQDHDFPLFVTYDRLCKLLEADMQVWEAADSVTSPGLSPTTSKRPRQPAIVTYRLFRSMYWPHFPENLTKGLDPALVYNEIMGVIKGSEEALQHSTRQLDASAYEQFSVRRQGTFASHRTKIYEIFTLYERRRVSMGHIDIADRTHSILGFVKQHHVNLLGQRVDYMYVDEVQDNLLIDTLLLRTICSNAQGLFWSGDTAQTISVGSSFKFNDMKAFLHRRETDCVVAKRQGAHDAPVEPALFQLMVNYRSHGGILACARTVLSILSSLWPHAIDNLPKDTAMVDGAPPVFFTGWDTNAIGLDQFLFGDGKDNTIEFGAQQCIIVRTEEAQVKLRKEVGNIGLIMTVYESKGLEFDDVVLYNFFADSNVSENQWRVVLNASDADDIRAPQFDQARHAGVCAELKSLYVALTRARKKIWIVDRARIGEPMRTMWATKIRNSSPSEGIPHLANPSRPEDWARKGTEMFAEKSYLQAEDCFKRGQQPHKAAIAYACYLKEHADGLPFGPSPRVREERKEAFVAAAKAFRACAGTEGNSHRDRQSCLRSAGQCFEEAGKAFYVHAAKCLEQAEVFMRSAQLYREVSKFDDAVRVVKDHGLSKEPAAKRIITAARVFYFTRDQRRKGYDLFDNPDECVEYLDNRGLDLAHADYLESLGRWSAAGDVHRQEGRSLIAARLYLRDGSQATIIRARETIHEALWDHIAFGRVLSSPDPEVERVASLLATLHSRGLDLEYPEVGILFRKLHAGKVHQLIAFAAESYQKGTRESEACALLALDAVFRQRDVFEELVSLSSATGVLQMLLVYVTLLVRTLKSPPTHAFVQRLLGVRPLSGGSFSVLPGTHLYRGLAQKRTVHSVPVIVTVSQDDLNDAFDRVLRALIHDQVQYLGHLHSRRCLRPPCHDDLGGACTVSDCSDYHMDRNSHIVADYNLRVHAHIFALLIFNAVDGLIDRRFFLEQERVWCDSLHQILRPASQDLGHPSMLDMALIPFGERGKQVLHSWVRPQLYVVHSNRTTHMTDVMRFAWTSFTFNGSPDDARFVTYNAPVLKAYRASKLQTGTGMTPVLVCMLQSFEAFRWLRDCFVRGIQFLKFVLDTRIPVDVCVLCDTFEYLISNLVFARQLASPHSPRTAVLPRTWCLAALRQDPWIRDYSPLHVQMLVHVAREVLIQLCQTTQQGSALYYRKPAREIPITVQSIILGRICNAMVIIGINCGFASLRSEILEVLHLLPSTRPLPFTESFVNAANWEQLEAATEASLASSQLDCMVRVYRRGKYRPNGLPESNVVTNVDFSTWDELRQKLRSLGPETPTRFDRLQHTAAGNYVARARPGAMAVPQSPSEPLLSPTGRDEAGQSAKDSSALVAADHPPIPEDDVPERRAAATALQARFRQRQKARAARAGPSGLITHFTACWTAAAKHGLSGLYVKLFLGPLPHVLHSLCVAEEQIIALKNGLKSSLRTAESSKYEVLDAQLTVTCKAHKRVKELRGVLKPDSEFHADRDVEALKRQVAAVGRFLTDLPGTTNQKFSTHAFRQDLALGCRGILDRPPSASGKRRVPLPSLNAQDL